MKKNSYKNIALFSFIACIIGIGIVFFIYTKTEYKGVHVDDIPFYSTPWGKDKPFFPGNINTEDKMLGNPEKIPSSSACIKCHKKEFDEWVPSLHSISGRDIVYEESIELNADIAKNHHGKERARFCDSCHNPMEVTMGRINPITTVMPSDVQTEGLACVFCHTATKADAQAGNGAITFDLNKAFDNISEAAIMASPRDHARAFGAKETNEILKSSEFCGACHNETYYPPITPGNKILKAQTTFDEWKSSWYAKNDVTCQDCHMNYEPIKFIENLQKDIIEKPKKYSHSFWGGNHVLQTTALEGTLLYLRGGVLPGVSVKRYFELINKQSVVTNKFIRAAAALEIISSKKIGDNLEVKVKVSNVGSGHNLPTGVIDQKHIWLELKAETKDGKTIFDNGAKDDDEYVIIWAERFLDKNGKIIMDHKTFVTYDIIFTREPIKPRSHQIITYKIPLNGEKDLKLTTNLWYKIAYDELIISTLHKDIPIPKFLMATNTKDYIE